MPKSIIFKESHSKGRTIVDYNDKLKCVLSAGDDGNVKVWSLIENDVVINYSLGDSVKSVVIENERMFSNVGNNLIEMRSIVTKSENPSVLTTFTGNINDIQFNMSKSKLISCSDDWNIKLLNLTEGGNYKEILFTGHKGPVFGVSMSCDDQLLASCSCDGSINVWNVSNRHISKSLALLEKYKDISNIEQRCRLKFHPNRPKMLAILLGKEIRLLDCDSWETLRTLSCDQSELLTEFSFNPDGNMIVAGTRKGWIYLWNIADNTALLKWRSKRKADISSIIWPLISSVHGVEKVIFSDTEGCWEMLEMNNDEFVPHSNDVDNGSLSIDELNELFDDDDELSVPNSQPTTRITQSPIDTTSSVVVKENKNDNLSEFSARQDENDTDLDADYDDAGEDNEISLADLKAEFESPSKKQALPPQPVTVTTTKIIREKRQPHVPVKSTRCPRNGNDQILMWNPIAAIKNHYDDENDHNCFLEIDFQDREVHRNLIYRHDAVEYDLGDVNRYALVLVSKQKGKDRDDDDEEDDDDDEEEEVEIREPAVVHVRSLNGSWKEWNITLPSYKEKVIGCCLVGEDYAVILSDRYLRYFMLGIGGMQVHIENIHGNPVAIVGSSSYAMSIDDVIIGNYVIVVVDDGSKLIWRLELLRPTRNGTRWMNRGTLEGVVATSDWHSLPLSASSTLKWIGFSDSAAVYTVDSKQIVRRLHVELDHRNHRFSAPRWTPVLNLRMAMNKECRSIDRYFPIGFADRNSESSSALVVHCRDSRYPTVVPWQHLSMVNMQLPLCGPPKSELIQLENSFILNQMIPDWSCNSSAALELVEKQLLLKLFANAINQDQDSRAYSIAKLMPDSQVIQLAIRYAARNNKRGLAERMGEIAFQKDEESKLVTDEADVKYSNEENDDSTIEKENMEADEIHEENNEDVNNFWTDIISEKTSNISEPVLDKNELSHPFKVVSQQSVSRKGLAVIDELGKNIPHKKSPKKQLNPFGNFAPSPCQQKFKIKSKRKSTVPPSECPLTKAMKK